MTYLRTFISTPARGLLQLYGTIEQLPKLVRSNLRRKEFIRLLVCLIFDLIGRHYVYVVVNFLFQLIFIFPLFWGMVMYANEFKTKEKQKLTEIKN